MIGSVLSSLGFRERSPVVESQVQMLEAYVADCASRNLIQWWFQTRGTPARDGLNRALFDSRTRGLRPLTSRAVRRAVWQCALQYETLHRLIAQSAGLKSDGQPLEPGDRIRLRNSLPILDASGKIIRVHRGGETWRVVGRDESQSVWLEQPDGCRQMWEDDREILAQFEKLAA